MSSNETVLRWKKKKVNQRITDRLNISAEADLYSVSELYAQMKLLSDP